MLGLPSFSCMTAKSMSFALAGTVVTGISVAIDIAASRAGSETCSRQLRRQQLLQFCHNGQTVFISNWACTEIVRLALRWTAETSVCRGDLLASSCNARVHVEKYQAGRIQAR